MNREDILDSDNESQASPKKQSKKKIVKTKLEGSLDDMTPSPSPSSRKRKSPASKDGNKKDRTSVKGLKWVEWEDQMVLGAIVIHGEKNVDWRSLLAEMNERRKPEEPRSIHSLKFHWANIMRPKIIKASKE